MSGTALAGDSASGGKPAALSASGRGLALVFPGQGAQHVGMGRDLYERYPAARNVFDKADSVLGFPLSGLCFEGPEGELTDTINAQPAILTMCAACLAVAKATAGHKLLPALVAGHSLGEYTALFAAGALAFGSALELVRERGRLMKEAGQRQPGAMAAVLGLQLAELQAICEQVGDVWVANDNSPEQTVLSGTKAAMEQALALAKQSGAKRSIPLAVSIASHSPLMSSAQQSMAAVLEGLPLVKAQPAVVSNVTALPIAEPAAVRQALVQQLTSRVRWVESVRYMVAQGIQVFIEIGPKNVLSRLISQIESRAQTHNVGNVTDIERLEAFWS